MLQGKDEALTDPHAEADQGALLTVPTQGEGGGHRQPGAAGAERMTERDRTTIGVDVLRVVGEAERTRAGQHLRGERLVDLDAVEVGQALAGASYNFV